MFELLSNARRAALKPSFVTRRVPLDAIAGVQAQDATLAPGDLVLAEVTDIGHHTKIELPDGRRAALHPGDEILVACGARYAPDQFEAMAPTAIGAASLTAAGGIVGIVTQAHDRVKPATAVRILGAAVRSDGTCLNLADFSLPDAFDCGSLPVIAVLGTSMNSGKTHSVASMVRGLRAAGMTVAALKATGTGAGGDLWRQLDAGAEVALDFTDVGFATTYQADPNAVEVGACRLLAAARDVGVDVAVMEIADGVRQAETAALIGSETFRHRLSGIVFAASDSMGAEHGVQELKRLGHRVLAVSGLLTRSPLMIREARQSMETPVLTAAELADPVMAAIVFECAIDRTTRPRSATMSARTSVASLAGLMSEAANVA